MSSMDLTGEDAFDRVLNRLDDVIRESADLKVTLQRVRDTAADREADLQREIVALNARLRIPEFDRDALSKLWAAADAVAIGSYIAADDRFEKLRAALDATQDFDPDQIPL